MPVRPRGYYDTQWSKLSPNDFMHRCEAIIADRKCSKKATQVGQCTLDRTAALGFCCDDEKHAAFMAKEIKRRAIVFDTALVIKRERETKGWSQEELARRARASVKQIIALENGDQSLSTPKSLKRIIETLRLLFLGTMSAI